MTLACGGDPPRQVEGPPSPSQTASEHTTALPPGKDPKAFAAAAKAFEAGNMAQAKEGFAKCLEEMPAHADSHAYLGIIAEREGDAKGAESHYVEALKGRPDLEAAAENLSAIYIDATRFADAARVAKGALEKHKDNAALRLNFAIALAGDGQASAAQEFDEALKRSPKDPALQLTAAHWLGALKKTEEAKTKLKDALALTPPGTPGVGLLASIGHEYRLLGAFPECVSTLDRAIGVKDVAELRTDRALCKMGQKDEAGTRADLEAAIKSDPKYAPAHFFLAGRLAQSAKLKEALKEYETYLQLAPAGPLKKQAEDRVQRLKDEMAKKPSKPAK